jgi:DNA polymerase I-like protein with 3'-5' exonuclease and polymerase domains
VIQALARIIVMGQLLQIAERYRVVFSVHDEVVCCVPESESDSCLEYMKSIMSLAPSWAIDLPLACEGTIGRNYGEVS